MVNRRVLQTRSFAAFMVVLAACGAALFAHVAIDLAGDVLLAHDTYDGLDHHSRGEVFAAALGVAAAALLRLIWIALAELRTGCRGPRLGFDEIFGRTPWRFIAAVTVLTLPALIAMESIDVVSAGGRVDDPTDLLGGSAALGLSLAAFAGTLVAVLVRCIGRIVLDSQHVLVAAIRRLIILLARPATASGARDAHFARRAARCRRSILARRNGKRGPPALAR